MAGSITILCGLSASGKSTWANQQDSYIIICPDEFRQVLTGRDYYAGAEEAVWSAVKTAARVLAGCQKRDILIDATAVTPGQRSQWIRMANELGVPIHCLVFDVPLEVCLERNQARERKVPEEVLNRQAELLETPSEDEGFASVRIIAGERKEN
jgi:predicted kinase